ncbi:hypothetical protein AK88_02173 [Plasmodium fragile]|uniref:Schizont-infected cell agglutination extracellular alpha domain-containing protein n=1 Tax=Plasmodium fragile TaxID=5857 RepID=A0A0D9QRC4_PLAFR|nr:uncharacterized protein AK88_02173 [Plasmodium fragile]KJP88226.1 hypothetical protein AK88_02173 [Plasmodium fragile]
MVGLFADDILHFLWSWEYYLNIKNITHGGKYWTQLMSEVNIIFQEVTTTISHGRRSNAGICAGLYNDHGQTLCRIRCKEIASLMLYIKGYRYHSGKWIQRPVGERSGHRFMEYLRCTLATEVLLQLYGNTDDHREIIQKVEAEMRQTHTSGKQTYEPGVCEGQHYGEVIFGLRGIGPSIKNRLEKWQQGLAGGHAGPTRGTGKQCAWKEQGKDQNNEDECTAEAGATPTNSELMLEITEWTDTGIFGPGRRPGQTGRVPGNVQHRPQPAPAPRPPRPPRPSRPAEAPAKPVAAKPVATPSLGTGNGTTSGGSVRKGVVTAAAGGQGKMSQTAVTVECDGHNVWGWKHREIYVADRYSDKEWKAVTDVLEEFIKYLQDNNDKFDAHGANCDNTGWNDMTDTAYHVDQRVADMMRCRIMSGALWFANGAGNNTEEWEKKSEDQKKEIERLRCEVAHVFGHLLKTRYCQGQQPWYRGVEYAWEIMRQMGDTKWGGVVPDGPVTKHECTECGYKSKGRKLGIVNADMATWLLLQWRVMDNITNMERTMECTKDWAEYQLQLGQHGNLTAQDADGKKKLEDVKEEAQKTAEDIVKKLQDEVKAVFDDLGNCTASRDNDCVKQLFEKEIQERAGRLSLYMMF